MTVHLWLSRDPQTDRVTAETREWSDGSFPAGARGRGWALRETDADEDTWAAMLAGELSPSEQDTVHQQWWNQAGQL